MQAGSEGLAHKSDYEGGRGTAGETCEVKGESLLRGKCRLRVRNPHRGAKRRKVGGGVGLWGCRVKERKVQAVQ